MTGCRTVHFEKDPLNSKWTYINSGFKKKAAAGVGIILSPQVKLIKSNIWIEGRILSARIILNGSKINAISAYSPTDATKSEASKDHFYHQLDKAIKALKSKHPSYKILIGGDMNATIGSDSYGLWNCLGRNNDELATNGNGRRLLTVCENNNLHIMNSLFDSKAIHRETWYQPIHPGLTA